MDRRVSAGYRSSEVSDDYLLFSDPGQGQGSGKRFALIGVEPLRRVRSSAG